MGRGGKRDCEKEAFWRMVLDEHQKSDLSVKEFCQAEGLKTRLFWDWRRKIRQWDAESTPSTKTMPLKNASPPPQPGVAKSTDSADSDSASSVAPFMPIKLTHESDSGFQDRLQPSQSFLPELMIETPAGFKVGLSKTVSIQRCREVIEVLMGLSLSGPTGSGSC